MSSKNMLFIFFLAFLAIIFNPYEDKSDMEIMAIVQQNREKLRRNPDHNNQRRCEQGQTNRHGNGKR